MLKTLIESCTSCTQIERPWRSKKSTGLESGRSTLGIVPEPTDRIRRVVGIGGIEVVLAKRIESLALGDIQVRDFPIQIGAMKYGFPLHGLLGTDFFVHARVVLDLDLLEVYPSSSGR